MTKVFGLYATSILIFLLSGTIVKGQGLYPVSIDEKVNHSSLIVEGKVISTRSYWNTKHTMIYTANEVEVYKVFKGEVPGKTIEITTVGGAVDGQVIKATEYLELRQDEIGIFFCQKDIYQPSSLLVKSYDVYSSAQGFFRYDLPTKTATAPFVKFDDIESGLYKAIFSRTGKQPKIKTLKFSVDDAALPHSPDGKVISSNLTLAPTITSFTPATVNAGALTDLANNVLTINGSGFGTGSGSAAVQFANGDAAAGSFYPVNYNSPYVVSWSNTQIKVRVPDKAANGTFRVADASGAVTNSPSPLVVRFSILNADLGGGVIKQFNLGNINGTGGYTIHYSTSTANNGQNIDASAAKQTFQRALNTWKEAVGVNIIEGPSTTHQTITADAENIVLYDNNATTMPPLAAGVLATCFSYLTFCSSNNADQPLKLGFDIVIRNPGVSSGSINFSLGPCPPYTSSTSQVDLESVLLHELGHALNLAHINDGLEGTGVGTTNPSKVMHFSVAYNFKRTSLDVSALSGAQFAVEKKGLTYGSCAGSSPEMDPLSSIIQDPLDNCPDTFPQAVTPIMTKVAFDLAHATSNKFVDPAYNQFTLDGTGTSVTNNSYYVIRTNSAGGTLAMNVADYATVPTGQEACVVSSLGVPVTGVQLSIYKVNSCPAGQSYPTPIVYTTFKADGALPVIDNLSGNANYLIVVDGVENTKSQFSLELSGTALSSRFTSFTGEVLARTNALEWVLGTIEDIASMSIERSEDGVTYNKLDDIAGITELNGTYTDDTPLTGTNYYRLAITPSSGGAVQYSTVVQLTRSQPAASF